MTKLLVINYYWPPCGGPNVQRWLNFVRHLKRHQVQSYVLTVDENQAAYPSLDLSLSEQIPSGTQVVRTPTREIFNLYKKTVGKGQIPSTNLANEPEPGLLQKAARFIRGNFFLPDPRRGWNRFALPEARRLIREEGIRTIVTAGPPHSTHLIGRRLKRENPDLNWIADLHDYWTDSSYVHKFYRTPIAHRIDLNYELSVLREADRILTDCQFGTRRLHAKVPHRKPEHFTGLSMGYDDELFPARKTEVQTHFRITYTGTITDNFESEVFFQALAQVRKKDPELPLRLCFVGLLAQEVRQLIQKHGLEDTLEAPGYVTHERSIAYLYASSVLFLITPNFEGEEYHVPGKLYEYLAVQKPIFCIAPKESETAAIIESCQAGVTLERSEPERIQNLLESWATKWKVQKHLDLPEGSRAFEQYSRVNETTRLAHVLKSLEK